MGLGVHVCYCQTAGCRGEYTSWFNIIIILLSTHITLLTSDSLREQTRSTVDGTDFRIPQKGRTFASHKYAGKSAVRYELGVDIMRGIWYGSRDHTLPERTMILQYLINV